MMALTALALLAPAAARSGLPELRLPSTVHVRQARLTLGAVATLTGVSDRCRNLLGAIDLGPAPIPGASTVVRATEIEAFVDSGLSRSAPDCVAPVTGERAVVINSEGEAADMDWLQRQAGVALENALLKRFEGVIVRPVEETLRPFPVLPGSHYGFEPADAERPRARSVVDVLIEEPGHRPWRYPIWFEVHAKQVAWQLDEAVSSGRPVAAVRKHRVTIDVSNLRAEPLPEDFAFEQEVAIRPLSPGEVLTGDAVARLPEVMSGNNVVLRFHSGGLDVQTEAVALESGRPGDRVRVRNKRSGEETVGRVNGPNDVEVIP